MEIPFLYQTDSDIESFQIESTLFNSIFISIEDLIEEMSIENGYLLNWAPCNIEDRALEALNTQYDAYACVYWDVEENNDTITNTFVNKIRVKINIRVPNSTIVQNSNFDNRLQLYKGLEDLKQVFGKNNNLNLEKINYCLYKNSSINQNGIRSGDRFCPLSLDVIFDIYYFQDKLDIFDTI